MLFAEFELPPLKGGTRNNKKKKAAHLQGFKQG